MKNTTVKSLILCTLLSLCSVSLWAEEQVVFEDAMNTMNNWSQGTLVTSDDTVDHAPYMKLNNWVTHTTLPYQLNTDWTLEADLRHTNFSRGLWIGLFDKDMKQGYAALWDSSLEKYFKGKGMFAICNVTSKDEKAVGFQSNSKRLSKPKEGPQLITDPKFAHVKLTWEAATGKLTLNVNGDEIATVTDPDYKTFETIVIRGNNYSLVDNVKVTIPKK
jgi:hypothetical protein